MVEDTSLSADAPPYERHIALEDGLNFRDLGGYETADGRRVHWRRFFRAGGLSQLTEADREVLRALGIATVVDLRSTAEWEAGRFPVEHLPVRFHHLPLIEEILDPTRYEVVQGMLIARYREIADIGAANIARAVEIVADPASHPVVVHCLAGKDRTGVLVAVILSLLGVPDETVVADYALSQAAMAELRARARAAGRLDESRPSEMIEEVFSAAPRTMEGLLAALRQDYGSVEGYARAAGVSAGTIDQLRRALLTDQA
jgi:protein-tyrosine phosphatase